MVSIKQLLSGNKEVINVLVKIMCFVSELIFFKTDFL